VNRPPHDGSEQDAFTRWRHNLYWRPGQRQAVKRRASRRVRRQARQVLRSGRGDVL
jgi:hypothetical protein